MPEKLKPTAANATVGFCSPQNDDESISDYFPGKSFFYFFSRPVVSKVLPPWALALREIMSMNFTVETTVPPSFFSASLRLCGSFCEALVRDQFAYFTEQP